LRLNLTIRARLTLLYFTVLALSFVAFFWICDVGFRRSIETNDYWLGLLNSGWELEPRFDRARHYQQALESVTVADVAAVARQYLTDARLIKLSAGF